MATVHKKLGYQFDPIYYQVALDHFCKNFVPASSSIVMSDSELTDGLTYIAKLDFGGMRHFSELPILFVKIVTFSVNSLRQWVGRQRRRTPLGVINGFLNLLRRWKNHVHKAFLELDNFGYQPRKEVAL